MKKIITALIVLSASGTFANAENLKIGEIKSLIPEASTANNQIQLVDGGSGDLGHPAVYFKFGKKKEIVCNYCNKKFIKKD